jgi:hypothetical protein
VEGIFAPAFKPEQVENVQLHKRSSKWYWLKKQ